MTLVRRSVLACVAVVAFLAAAPAWAEPTGGPAATVKTYTDRLTGIVNGPASVADKQTQLQAAVDQSVDVQGIARFCLGRYWTTATQAQQQEFVSVFRRSLLISLTGQISQYQGVIVAVGQARSGQEGDVVASSVSRPNNAPAHVDWVLGPDRKVVDVVAEGTSLRLTTRQDYASFLTGHGGNVQTLIDTLRQKVAS